MKDNKILKFLLNKYYLFILPYLVFLSRFLMYYVDSEKYDYSVPLSALGGFYILMFIIYVLYMFLINKITSNYKINCILLCCFMFSLYITSNPILIIPVLFVIIIIALLFKYIDVPNVVMFLVSSFFSFIFLFDFIQFSFINIDLLFHSNYDRVNYSVKINKNIDNKPNIFYIHCDGMMSMEAMEKYFEYDDDTLNTYLDDNNFIINRDVSLRLGHRTQKALVALYNPYYYDNKEKKFLDEVEDYEDNKGKVHNYISYKELEDKRMNSELVRGLSDAGYTTYAVGLYNQHTSLNVDYFYDYNYYAGHYNHKGKNLELVLIDKDINKIILNSYINYQIRADLNLDNIDVHNKVYSNYKSLFKKVEKRDVDLSEYKRLHSTLNEKVRKTVESLSYIYDDKSNSKFVFVDFDLNHIDVSYDRYGNEIDSYSNFKVDYRDNYIYTTYLLVDLVRYIKDNDDNAIIILQSDHGIHSMECDDLKGNLKIKSRECKNVRNSMFSALYIPDEYKNGDEEYLNNPLNISRYLINNYVGKNYKYI